MRIARWALAVASTAALGGEIEIPTIDGGRARVVVPEGAQTGRKLRLRGKGMPSVRQSGHTGDLFVEMFVETPRNMTARQKELLREFCDCTARISGSLPPSSAPCRSAHLVTTRTNDRPTGLHWLHRHPALLRRPRSAA